MNPLFFLAIAGSLTGRDDGNIPVDAAPTSAPKGPGNPATHSYTRYQPLPKPASQAKRRRKQRRTRK